MKTRAYGRVASEIKFSEVGKDNLSKAEFNLAVKKDYAKNKEDDTDFFWVTALGPKADTISRYFCKGSRIFVDLVISNNNYERDGEKIFRDQYLIANIEFVDTKAEREAKFQALGLDANVPVPAVSSVDATEDFTELDDDGDLPF